MEILAWILALAAFAFLVRVLQTLEEIRTDIAFVRRYLQTDDGGIPRQALEALQAIAAASKAAPGSKRP